MSKQRKVTVRQEEVLRTVAQSGLATKPRNTLERLQKKGLVSGDRKRGWVLTTTGHQWLKEKK